MDINLKLRALWDDVDSSLWFRPTVVTLVAIGLAFATTSLDHSFAYVRLLPISADNARAVLTAIASSMLTVVGLVFSILMVALVLASQQFSPRILRNFARDRESQNVLSLFIGTFIYSLLVLGRISESPETAFIPVLSVIVAIAFALLGVVALVLFIDHIAVEIRASHIMAEIDRDTVALLRRRGQQPATADSFTPPAEEPAIIGSRQAGYIQAIDREALVALANTHGAWIEVTEGVGAFMVAGGALFKVWPQAAAPLAAELQSTVDIGTERTLFEDALFGVRQLVDIALKAISPAVNDPTTAVNCLDYLTNILVQAAQQPDEAESFADGAGRPCLRCPAQTFDKFVALAYGQIRQYSRSEPTLTVRLLDSIATVAQVAHKEAQRDQLRQQLAAIKAGAVGLENEVDLAAVTVAVRAAQAAVGSPD